jgi:hypothetical protein
VSRIPRYECLRCKATFVAWQRPSSAEWQWVVCPPCDAKLAADRERSANDPLDRAAVEIMLKDRRSRLRASDYETLALGALKNIAEQVHIRRALGEDSMAVLHECIGRALPKPGRRLTKVERIMVAALHDAKVDVSAWIPAVQLHGTKR